MISKPIEDTQARCDAVDAAAKTFFEGLRRVYSETFKPLANQEQDELLKGIVMFGASGEKGYKTSPGLVAKKGTTRIQLLMHIKVNETDTGKTLRQKEQAFFAEVKSFVQTGVAGVSLTLDQVQQSRQMAHPYGWALAYLDITPPAAGTH